MRRFLSLWGALVWACGSSSDLGGVEPGPSTVGGRPATGGRAATGGSAAIGSGGVTGGSQSGGAVSGGAPPMCATVTTLPAMGTQCGTVGESRCLANGDRCLCERGIWYCNTACGTTAPTPDTACTRGTACTYASGVSCACINMRWMCISTSSCPAKVPTTGQDCTGATGMACDYPNSDPSLHFACACMSNSDAGSGASWTCIQSGPCPAVQPQYRPNEACPAAAICSYGTTRCGCLSGTPWICM